MSNSKNPFAVAKEMMLKNASKAEANETADQSYQMSEVSDNSAENYAFESVSSNAAEYEIPNGKTEEEDSSDGIAKLLAGPKSKKSHMVPMLLDFALKEIKERENSAMKARGEKGTKKTEDDYVIQAMIEFFNTPGLRADCLKSAAQKLESIL